MTRRRSDRGSIRPGIVAAGRRQGQRWKDHPATVTWDTCPRPGWTAEYLMESTSLSRSRSVGAGLLLFAAYVVTGKLGLRLAFSFPSATPVWPSTGLALVAFLLLGRRVWPAVLAGAFLVNVTTAGTILTSLGIAAGNTLEGLLGASLLLRFAGGRDCLESAEGGFKVTDRK